MDCFKQPVEEPKELAKKLSLKAPIALKSAKESIKNSADKSIEDALKYVEKNIIVTAHNRLKSSYKVAEALEISQSKAYRLIRKHCGDAVY